MEEGFLSIASGYNTLIYAEELLLLSGYSLLFGQNK